MKIDKILNSFKQFGLLGFISRAIRRIGRIVGVEYEDYYLLSLTLRDYELSNNTIVVEGVETRRLSNEDFIKSYESHNYLMLSPPKIQLINERFSERYEAFGAFYNGELIYASWISYSRLEIPGAEERSLLSEGNALLLDDFCAPHMRQKGIHGLVNLMRLKALKENNVQRVIVTVMCVNKPALKSHIKNGFAVVFKYYTLRIIGEFYSNLNINLNKYGYSR